MGLFNWFTQEIAIDLGTANTLIIHNDEVVVNEPSIVALNRNNPKEVLAVGKRALMMHEKTHESIRTVRPLKDGVIADFNAAELMIRELIKLVYPKKPLFPPSWRMMICIPSSITEVEKRAVRDSAEQAGLRPAHGCRMGICNTCSCTKVQGVVRNLLTGELDQNNNTQIKLCISQAVSPVVINL